MTYALEMLYTYLGESLFYFTMHRMKIGIVTHYSATNMGAILQCFALQEALKELQPGALVKVLDFRRKERLHRPLYADVYKYKAKGSLAPLKGLAHIYYAFRQRMKSGVSHTQEFIDKYLDLEKVSLTEDKFLDVSGKGFNVLVAGSDQIWADWSIQPYFLLGCSSYVDCKIAYAPSLGNIKSLSDRAVSMLSTAISEFDYISCREEDGCDFISKMASIHCPCVPDPTFLLTRNQWRNIAKKPEKAPVRDFVFCYQISFEKMSLKIANAIADKYGLEVVFKRYVEPYAFYADIGPSEFLWYIMNAKFVVTSSFHCTLFSVFFGTPFLSIRSDAPQSRLTTLLKAVGLEDRLVLNLSQAMDLPDENFKVDKAKIQMLGEKGKLFLHEGLKSCNSRLLKGGKLG